MSANNTNAQIITSLASRHSTHWRAWVHSWFLVLCGISSFDLHFVHIHAARVIVPNPFHRKLLAIQLL